MRLGILGGTFDPIHLGHLRTAEEIGQKLNLEKVYLIPSASPPHKSREPVTPFDHRLAMTRLAVADSPLLDVLDLEGRRPGFSYSIETLKEIHSTFGPDLELFFIIGMDAFLEIKTWREYQNLFNYAHFVIIMQAGFQPEEIDSFIVNLHVAGKKMDKPGEFITRSGKSLILMTPTLIDISSTRIRKMIAEGKSIRFLVAESVRDYIREKGLYGNYANTR